MAVENIVLYYGSREYLLCHVGIEYQSTCFVVVENKTFADSKLEDAATQG